MATTTAKAFDDFNEAIKPSTATKEKVAARRDVVVDVLKKAFPSNSNIQFQSARIIGSLGRKTATNPVHDLDLMTVLYVEPDLWRKYQRDSSDFLYRVRRAVNGESKVKKVGARGQAVSIFYQDGLTVDVAAMVKYDTGGYGIPDGSGNWLTTNPIRHEEYLNEQNDKLIGDLKKIVRFAKQWNKAHSSRLASFHLEMLVARTFASMGTNYRTALRLFFDYNHYNLSVQDPAGYSGDLSSYLTWNAKSDVNDSFKAARDRADLALAAEDRGDHREAIRHWGIILGKSFPSYG
ncbi:hypothetical protein [Kitasatospora sp. NPDC058190]|uniref:SMODS domain-containing nucleotidyltransferase n=1 Tax=Kitasatospora sp. NPDC058190 TaxID=3346371 RepID=UPI0036D76777